MDDQPGVPDTVIEEFLAHLQRRGRGSYTVRSYRLGLGHFDRWLTSVGCGMDGVSRHDVEAYIDEFARGEPAAARPHAESRQAPVVVDLASRQPRSVVSAGRAPRTINHRLSVLASFFSFLIERDTDHGGVWAGRVNPVPRRDGKLVHGMPGGGDPPPRGRRAELRRREPRELPHTLDPAVVQRLIDGTLSWRDRAILIVLARTGQRIGDWSDEHGRHGVLGMRLADLDTRTSTMVVRLKGARDEHRVPVTEEFWTAFDRYLARERGDPPTEAAWVGLRRGRGKPLTYAAFEAGLRYLGRRIGIDVTAHMFRHTVATEVVATSGGGGRPAAARPPARGDHGRHLRARRCPGAGRRGGWPRASGPCRGRGSGRGWCRSVCVPLRLPNGGRVGGGGHASRRDRAGVVTGTVETLARARRVGQAPYDRDPIAAHLEQMTAGLLISDGSVVPRRRRAIHAVCDVLDGQDGRRLVDRWAGFETEVWPAWKAGDGRPRLSYEWSFGVRAFAISRMVCPSVTLSLQVRVAQWFDLLPADDPLRQARDQLRKAMTSALVGSARSHENAVTTGVRLMLACGVDRLGELTEDDMLKLLPGTKGADVLDSVLCQLGVFDRTPRGGASRHRTTSRHTPRELAVVHGVPVPFVDVVAAYLETYARRLSDAYGTLRAKARALAHFFQYLQAEHPQVDTCARITPAQARGFVGYAVKLARRSQRQRDHKGTADRTTAHSWLIDVRVFFADICTWATEDGSPFAAHAPVAVPLTRHDLLDAGFRKARQRRDAWMTSTVLDLQREIPNIRAFALRRWHEADQAHPRQGRRPHRGGRPGRLGEPGAPPGLGPRRPAAGRTGR
ncbi:MAG TPA: site-specific integrase [Jiangellaceae bacterium]|nr:site-specific integrase [Jiangellaceae bacterium]